MEFSKWAAVKLSRADFESNFEASTVTTAVFLSRSVVISTTPGSGESVFLTSIAQPIQVIPGMLSDTNVMFAFASASSLGPPAGIELDKSFEDELLTGPLLAGVHPAASRTSKAGNQRDFIACSCSCVWEKMSLTSLSAEKPSRSISVLCLSTLTETNYR